jgi:hypothetical protein
MSRAVWQEGITTRIFDIVIPIPSEFINSAFTVLPAATNHWRGERQA